MPVIKEPAPFVAIESIIPETISDNPKSIVPAHTHAKLPTDSLLLFALFELKEKV